MERRTSPQQRNKEAFYYVILKQTKAIQPLCAGLYASSPTGAPQSTFECSFYFWLPLARSYTHRDTVHDQVRSMKADRRTSFIKKNRPEGNTVGSVFLFQSLTSSAGRARAGVRIAIVAIVTAKDACHSYD